MAARLLEIDAANIDELTAAAKAARSQLSKELRAEHKVVGTTVAEWARFRALAGTPAQRHFIAAIQGSATRNYARVTVRRSGPHAGAAATYFGARPLTRHGWNAGRKRATGSSPQYPPWVGNSWRAGVMSEGPYVINRTIAANRQRIADLYGKAADRALDRTFGKVR